MENRHDLLVGTPSIGIPSIKSTCKYSEENSTVDKVVSEKPMASKSCFVHN